MVFPVSFCLTFLLFIIDFSVVYLVSYADVDRMWQLFDIIFGLLTISYMGVGGKFWVMLKGVEYWERFGA